MFIQTEQTPNPQTLKFLPGKVIMEEGTAFFQSIDDAKDSPFGKRLLGVDGIDGVFFGSDFITITKSHDLDWEVMKPLVLGAIMDHFNSNDETVVNKKDSKSSDSLNEDSQDSDIVKQIKELLNTRVRPAVAMDGGDIVYQKFEEGIVYLHMQGACSGCPSSTATLKMGIENMLKHYVPEVLEVRPIDV
jgi:Fe-S cluster biogenesis protein NfuA